MLYHVRHPLLALEIVCALTQDVAIVDSFVTDPDDWQEHAGEIPSMEFYELDELGNQFGNWVGPTVSCLLAMCRAAGFARVEFLGTGDHHAVVACYRKWEAGAGRARRRRAGSPDHRKRAEQWHQLFDAEIGRVSGLRFSHDARYGDAGNAAPGSASDFGAACLFVTPREATCLASDVSSSARPRSRLAHRAAAIPRQRLSDASSGSQWMCRPRLEQIDLKEVFDGVAWTKGEVKVGERGFLSCWVGGLPENADRANVRAFLGNRRLEVDYVGRAERRRVSADQRRGARRMWPQGDQEFRVECAGVSSGALPVAVRIQSSSK